MVEIIAEIGINHQGDMSKAIDLIWNCKRAGANVVKFQLYDPKERPDIDIHPWKDILLKSALTKRQVFDLKAECDRANIEFLASCFDKKRIGWCEAIGVKRYKIASKSAYDFELCNAIRATGKPIIQSFGGIRMVNKFPSVYFAENNLSPKNIKPLYCVSDYPTDLRDIHFYQRGFNIFAHESLAVDAHYDGFSDHTIGFTASIAAMSLGAAIIEKHITPDKSLPGPDHILSLTTDELALLCQFRDEIEQLKLTTE